MAPPINNQFWKQRSTHGKDILFSSPSILWEAACEYFQWCDENPWITVEQLKKPTVTKQVHTDAKKNKTETQTVHYIAELPVARPYTLTGLCLFLDIADSYFREFKSTPRKSVVESGMFDDFMTVITRIEKTIYTQKFEGAAVGVFNANIIARDLGLVDKKELSGSLETDSPDLSKLSAEELDLYIALEEKARRA